MLSEVSLPENAALAALVAAREDAADSRAGGPAENVVATAARRLRRLRACGIQPERGHFCDLPLSPAEALPSATSWAALQAAQAKALRGTLRAQQAQARTAHALRAARAREAAANARAAMLARGGRAGAAAGRGLSKCHHGTM